MARALPFKTRAQQREDALWARYELLTRYRGRGRARQGILIQIFCDQRLSDDPQEFTHGQLAACLHVSVSAIKDALRRLQAEGVLAVSSRGNGWPNGYRIIWPRLAAVVGPCPSQGVAS